MKKKTKFIIHKKMPTHRGLKKTVQKNIYFKIQRHKYN